jgi:hypothetical protein
MRREAILLRLAGLAALAGAGLRLAAAFPATRIPGLSGEPLYFTVDLLLSLGLVGLFAGSARFRTWLGVLGFAGALAGFELIRTGDRLGGPDAYQRGSAILGLGLAVAGLALAQGRGLTRYVGGAWLLSLAVGLAGSALHRPAGFLVASLFFCLGFALGGVALLRGADYRALRAA